jgi:hypothetical protein
MMYATGKAMWANVSVPNTRFEPHKYMVTILTDQDTAADLEAAGLKQSTDRAGNTKYDEPAFMFSKTAIRRKDGAANKAPKLIDSDGNPLDCLIGNGSNITVKVRPYSTAYGTFGELVAVKVNELVDYDDSGDDDNEEF